MRASLMAVLPVCLLAACSRGEPQPAASPTPTETAATAKAAPASASAAPAAATARKVKDESELFSFEYSYPAAAGAIAPLKAWLDADVAERRSELASSARAMRQESQNDGYEFRAPGFWQDWAVVTDLPGWLSLSGTISTYEGGAHPNHGFDALVWDRKAGVRRSPADLFVSKAALAQALRADFCRELDAQRRKKRGAEWQLGGDFDDCIDPAESTVILGSAGRKGFDRIGVLVAPYEAGPYAEGSYEVTLPVTPAVLAAVKPEFRSAFAAAR